MQPDAGKTPAARQKLVNRIDYSAEKAASTVAAAAAEALEKRGSENGVVVAHGVPENSSVDQVAR